MSFFSDASLVLVPSGVKDSKVYSIKPTDGSGDLTFTRNSNATRVNADGLVEKVRENYITYSQDFSNAAWTKNTGVTLTANQIDPNGGTQAFKVDYSAANKELYQYLGSQSGQRTISVYLKGTAGETINLYDGISNSVKTLSASWQRFTITNTFSGGQYISINTYGGNARTIYAAFAQAEVSDFGPTDYIPTTSAAVSVGPTANVPRLDYSGACPSLLLEPQRTNAFTFSEQMDNAAYNKNGYSVSPNYGISPDGYQNADLVYQTVSGDKDFYRTFSSTTGAFSVYAKAAGKDWFCIFDNSGANAAWYNISNGTLGTVPSGTTATITAMGNDWYRLTYYRNQAGIYQFFKPVDANNSASGTASGTDGALVWGAQYEATATYSTSYIPTLGASVTRLADAAYKTGISSLIGQTEGTFFVEAKVIDANGGAFYQASISDGTSNNAALLGFMTTAGQIRFRFENGGIVQAEIFANGINTSNSVKMALAYKANDFVLYVNGVQAGTDTSGSIPSFTQFQFANGTNTSTQMYGSVNQALLFKTRLSNADLATLTAL